MRRFVVVIAAAIACLGVAIGPSRAAAQVSAGTLVQRENQFTARAVVLTGIFVTGPNRYQGVVNTTSGSPTWDDNGYHYHFALSSVSPGALTGTCDVAFAVESLYNTVGVDALQKWTCVLSINGTPAKPFTWLTAPVPTGTEGTGQSSVDISQGAFAG